MIKTEWIRSFAQVVELGSFSAVAIEQNVSPMAISKQIRNLEKQVEEALFNRSGKNLQLTEAGHLLLERSQLLRQEHAALSDWLFERHKEPTGLLRVIAHEDDVINLTITPWISEFLNLYPKIQLDISVKPSLVDIEKDVADVYWGLGYYLVRFSPGIKRKRLVSSKYGVYASPEYIAKYGTPKGPDDLSDHFLVGYAYDKPSNMLIINPTLNYEGEMDSLHMNTRVVSTVGNIEMAIQGLGIINASDIVPHVKSAVNSGKLVPILETYWYSPIHVYAYYHQVRSEQPKVRAFLDFFTSKQSMWEINET